MSTQPPKFDQLMRASLEFVAPVASTQPALAGEVSHASPPSLPAATVRNTPALDSAVTAVFSAVDLPPPSDMLATALPALCPLTQFTPLMMPDSVPVPSQSSTRTACSLTFLATP